MQYLLDTILIIQLVKRPRTDAGYLKAMRIIVAFPILPSLKNCGNLLFILLKELLTAW